MSPSAGLLSDLCAYVVDHLEGSSFEVKDANDWQAVIDYGSHRIVLTIMDDGLIEAELDTPEGTWIKNYFLRHTELTGSKLIRFITKTPGEFDRAKRTRYIPQTPLPKKASS